VITCELILCSVIAGGESLKSCEVLRVVLMRKDKHVYVKMGFSWMLACVVVVVVSWLKREEGACSFNFRFVVRMVRLFSCYVSG
jgi:hypothetical protein